jgi:hypothetical protein
LEWPDFDARLGVRAAGNVTPSHDDIRESICRQMQRIQEIIDRQLTYTTVALSLPSIGARAAGPQPGWLVNGLDAILLRCVADLTIWAAERKNIKLLNPQRLDARSPSNTRWDVRSNDRRFSVSVGSPDSCRSAQPFDPSSLPKKVSSRTSTTRCGRNRRWPASTESWSLDRHSHIRALSTAASRYGPCGRAGRRGQQNDPATVRQAFSRPDLLLDVKFPVEVSWGQIGSRAAKYCRPGTWGRIASCLSGDSPIELRCKLPSRCLLFPEKSGGVPGLLDRLRDMFGKHAISEDTLRLGSLRVPALE